MKIRLYGINFAPELTGIGKYTGEMAAWLPGAASFACVQTHLNRDAVLQQLETDLLGLLPNA